MYILIRACTTGSDVPDAVRRVISTLSLRLRVCSSVKEIGFLFDEGEEDEGEDDGEDEGEDEADGEDEEEGEDEADGEDEGEPLKLAIISEMLL